MAPFNPQQQQQQHPYAFDYVLPLMQQDSHSASDSDASGIDETENSASAADNQATNGNTTNQPRTWEEDWQRYVAQVQAVNGLPALQRKQQLGDQLMRYANHLKWGGESLTVTP